MGKILYPAFCFPILLFIEHRIKSYLILIFDTKMIHLKVDPEAVVKKFEKEIEPINEELKPFVDEIYTIGASSKEFLMFKKTLSISTTNFQRRVKSLNYYLAFMKFLYLTLISLLDTYYNCNSALIYVH